VTDGRVHPLSKIGLGMAHAKDHLALLAVDLEDLGRLGHAESVALAQIHVDAHAVGAGV